MAEEKTAKAVADEKAQKAALEEKGQGRTWTKKLDKKYGKSQQLDLVDRDPLLPPALEEKLRKTLPFQKVIIPSDLARKNNIRVSTLKALLHQLEAEGKVKLFASSDRLKVFTGVDSDKKPPKEEKGEKAEKGEKQEKGDKAKAKEEKAKAKEAKKVEDEKVEKEKSDKAKAKEEKAKAKEAKKEAKEKDKDKESKESKEAKPEEAK